MNYPPPHNRYDDLDRVWDDRALRAYGRFTDRPVRTTAIWAITLLAVVVLITVVINLLGIANIYWGAAKSKATVTPRVTQQVYGTDNALHNVSYFHDQCNRVLSDEQNVINATQQLKTDRATLGATTDPIAQQQAGTAVQQDTANLVGTKDQLSTDARDYDSKSATYTANPFKAANLPYRINVNPATGELSSPVNCR